MDRQIYVFGYPSDCGGASTELWHLVKLWRRNGCAVTLIPTWSVPKGWQAKTDAIGCRTLPIGRDEVALPDGSLVVSLCNGPFLAASKRLRNCRLIYLPCMTSLNDPLESQTYREEGPFDAYVFQSRYQRHVLAGTLGAAGVPQDRCHTIPGAFDVGEFPFAPLYRNGDFVFGRLSRPDPRKFTADWWQQCDGFKSDLASPVQCRTMGWHRIAARKCGPPPAWCEALPKCAEPVGEFLGSLHSLVQLGDVAENWPRVGLEAMAAGVPVIADAVGGWCEMIEHGKTGFLADNSFAAFGYLAELVSDETLRLEIAQRARQAVVEKLADETLIWQQWSDLFASLDG